MAYGKSKVLAKSTKSDKAFEIANPNYDSYQRQIASMVYKFFDKKSFSGSDVYATEPNYQLENELHR